MEHFSSTHNNWNGGPFRLPPPPQMVIVDDNDNGEDNNAISLSEKKEKVTPLVIAPPVTTTTTTTSENMSDPAQEEDMDLDGLNLESILEQVLEIFPEADLETTRAMLLRASLENVMNELAEVSFGAWGEVDSICDERRQRRRRSGSICSSIDSSIGDDDDDDDISTSDADLQVKLEQVMEIFPNVSINRSEELLKRNSISTVLVILASEAEY
jgi:hypothetical protein